MRVQLLGPVTVFGDDGHPIDIGGPKQRTVLAALCIDPGRPVSTDTLANAVWGDDQPERATRSLATYVSNLRGVFGEHIQRDGSGYVARLDRTQIDALVFEDYVATARRELDGDPVTAGMAASRALELWQGSPLRDIDGHAVLAPTITRLTELHAAGIEIALESQIATGRYEQAAGELQLQVAEHPHREHLRALLMRALYASGRQTEALATYRDFKDTLADDFGLDPSPELQELELRILQQDPALLPERPAPPSELVTPPPAVGATAAAAEATPAAVSDRSTVSAAPPARTVRQPEQRLATFVLIEIVGHDTLLDVAGPDDAERITAEMTTALSAVFEELGGSAVAADGPTTLVAFGSPVAHEDDSYRAILAALRFDEASAEVGKAIERSWGVEVGVRTAVSTLPVTISAGGEIELDDELTRLPTMLVRAGSGSVLVDDHTQAQMGELFSWDPDPIEVSDGATAWRARGVRGEPDKARMGRRLQAPFIGRDPEVAKATEMLESLHRGVGGVLILNGEAGVGKSRLVQELQDSAVGREPTWLVGHCVPHGEATPYWPFRNLLRSWLELGIDDADLKARVALHRQLEESLPDRAADLYPYLGGILGITLEPAQQRRLDLASEALQYRTFEVVAAVLDGLAAAKPLVVVIEDLHWADPTSIQLLDDLLLLTERASVLLVLTTRHDPDHPSRQLIDEANRRSPHVTTEIALELLRDDAQHEMLEALIGSGTLPESTELQVLRLAEGNPFYLEELVGALADEGVLAETADGWAYEQDAEVSVPETVEKVVQARIDRLGGSAHDVVMAGSVLGRSFGLPLLQGVLGGSADVGSAIRQLLRLDLLVEARRRPQPEYAFKHVLIQEAAYNTLPDERRAELHQQAASWLERRHAGNEDEVAGLLARHWAAAGVEEKAVASLIRAGDLARRDHALDEAIGHYRELLPILEHRGDRRTMALVQLKLGLALHTALRFRECNAVYQRAFELWDPEPGPEPTAILRLATPPFVNVPDPIRSYWLPDMQLQMALFDRLVERWPDDTLVPSLAERWDISDDGLRYRFVLREGLTWSDGHPLTAADVVFGVKRNLDPERPGISVAMLYVIEGAQDYVEGRSTDDEAIGIRALDERTVEFRLLNPAPYFLAMLNRPDTGPHPRHAIERHGDDWGAPDHEVVSGAFRRQSVTDDRVILERRPDYQGTRRGNVRIVEWEPNAYGSLVDAYEASPCDLLWIAGSWDGSEYDRLPAKDIHSVPPAGLLFLVFNHEKPELMQVDLRRALAHGIDRSALNDRLPTHTAPATGGIVPPPLVGHTPDIAIRFDPERGGGLLRQVQVPDPLRIAVLERPDTIFAPAGRLVAEMWRQHLELDVECVEVPPDVQYDTDQLLSDGVDAFLNSWYPGYTDPEYFLRLLLHSQAADNFARFSDEEYDDLVERAQRASDERTRLALFHEADRLAVDSLAAVVPLVYSSNVSVRRPGVTGWWEVGKSWANFADITVADPGKS